MRLKTVTGFIKHVLDGDCIGIAAQTAFFFLLSFFPLGMFMGWALSALNISPSVLQGFLPSEMIDIFIGEGRHEPLKNPLTFLGSFWAASTGMWALMQGVNRAYTGKRLTSFWARIGALLFTAGFLAVMALTVAILALGKWLTMLAVGAAILLLLFALYTLTPGTSARPRRAFWTAAAATGAWLAVSRGFELYLRLFANYSALYGSLGIVLGLALWIYIICIVIVIGAELGGYSPA